MAKKIPVMVLGATGSVGQRFVQLLDNHPWFEVSGLTGSDRRAGQRYGESCHWVLDEPMPDWAREMPVLPSNPLPDQAQLAFSALPPDVAKEVEPEFAQAGIWVCSNASAYRKEQDVPILLPEVNAEHVHIVKVQQEKRGWKAGIVTNPNCASTGLTVALKALQDAFGLKKAFVVTLQSVSGAGYPGLPSLDILDNVIPYIGGEEDKLEYEPKKMLGAYRDGSIQFASLAISAQVNRVPTTDGHLANVSLELETPVSPEEAIRVLEAYQAPADARDLPSSPRPPIVVRREPDRPQIRIDRRTGHGMTTVVGRVRPDPLLHLRMVVLSHNTIRGAAGGAVYNAELLASCGYVKA
jgi:aspartate-semialdehyde dehydrogenase